MTTFLTLDDPNLPTTANQTGGGFSFGIDTVPGGSSSLGNVFGVFSLTPTSPLSQTESVTVPSYSGTTITVTPPSDASLISAITIPGDTTYTPALNPNNPQPGEFTFSGTGSATIYLQGNSQPPPGTTFDLFYISNTYTPQTLPTNEVPGPFPGFYQQWNVEAEVSFQRTFEGPPTCTIKIATIEENKGPILDAFRNKQPIQIYDMGFMVESTKFRHLPPNLYPDRWVEIEVQLTGRHQYQLEKIPVRLLAAAANAQQTAPIKFVPIANFCNLARINPQTREYSENGVGLAYTGVPLTVILPQDTAYEAANTVGSLLQEHVRLGEAFVYLSNPGAIETRQFGRTNTHYLSDADILSELNYSYPGQEFVFQGVQLASVLKNTEMSLQQTEQPNGGVFARTICDPAFDDPSIPPANIRELRDGNLCYDQGGPSKKRICRRFIGDTVMSETEIEYGFAFCATDVYYYATVNVNGQNVNQWIYDQAINPRTFWRAIRSTTTTYNRNQFGYLERIWTRGQVLTRLKQEGNKETLALRASLLSTNDSNTQSNLQKQIDAYRIFFPLPTEKTTEYDLEYFGSYFQDTPVFPNDPRVNAANFVPEMFASEEITTELSYGVYQDPAGTPQNPKPPIAVGKLFRQTKSTAITSTVKGREAFIVTTETQNSEGSNLKNSLNIAPTEFVKGRPQPAERGDIRVVLSGPLPTGAIDPNKYRYILNTVGNNYPTWASIQGSTSYPTYTPEEGRRAAETESAIQNSQNSERLDVVVAYNRGYQEGDLIWVRGFLYVIFSISWTEQIYQGGDVRSDGMQLSLGRYLRPPVSLTYLPILDALGRPV